MYTIVIYEAFGVKFDERRTAKIPRVKDSIKSICPTAVIHYIEEVPRTPFFTQQPKQIRR